MKKGVLRHTLQNIDLRQGKLEPSIIDVIILYYTT